MSDTRRPTWAEINLDALAYNFHSVKNFVGENLDYMAMVKADAYGHSAVRCAKRFEKEGVDWFGVALPDEGLELRHGGIKKDILCLSGFWKGQENILIENDLTPVIFQIEQAEIYNRAAQAKKIKADVHIEIDTGMGRVGLRYDAVREFARSLKKFEYLNVEGLMTHFAAADDLDENDFTNLQIKRFYEAVDIFEFYGFSPKYKDLANSPGAIAHKNSRGNLVRLGGILYGLGGDVLPPNIEKPDLKPVLSLHSKIALLKHVPKGETLGYGRTFKTETDSLIATIPVGYHDGYNRSLSNKSKVIINGCLADVVGRISMDWITVDVTKISNVKIDDEVILIGKAGELEIKSEDLAEICGSISYEITCGIGSRVWRKYVESE